MLFRVIDKNEIEALVRGFATSYEVVGPVKRGESYVFDEIGCDPSRLCVDYTTTLLPPKKYLLPPREVLFKFSTAQNSVQDFEQEIVPRVLFGLHACDINAINRLDKVYIDDEYDDPYYHKIRENTLIVGISCMPSEHCFCNVWGTDEVTQGYDLFLHDIGDRYLVSILSVRAAEVLTISTSAREASVQDSVDFQTRNAKFRSAFPSANNISELPMLMDAFYNDALWEELGERCLSCAACSVVCPTCHCFNIKDILSPNGEEGTRVRVWDSCCSPDFAAVAHGHNFRATAASRVRNRFYHKFLGYPSKHGDVLCTGCGRCEVACKATINPRVVIDGLQQDAIAQRNSAIDKGVARG
ncbi:MAG: 4Fe-4S ferredoxin [Actinobacteria bacterium]|nr:4Fe-4S ferredoxin [Actinomycetota bacterium]